MRPVTRNFSKVHQPSESQASVIRLVYLSACSFVPLRIEFSKADRKLLSSPPGSPRLEGAIASKSSDSELMRPLSTSASTASHLPQKPLEVPPLPEHPVTSMSVHPMSRTEPRLCVCDHCDAIHSLQAVEPGQVYAKPNGNIVEISPVALMSARE